MRETATYAVRVIAAPRIFNELQDKEKSM